MLGSGTDLIQSHESIDEIDLSQSLTTTITTTIPFETQISLLQKHLSCLQEILQRIFVILKCKSLIAMLIIRYTLLKNLYYNSN